MAIVMAMALAGDSKERVFSAEEKGRYRSAHHKHNGEYYYLKPSAAASLLTLEINSLPIRPSMSF